MNKARRKSLETAIGAVAMAVGIIESARDEESNCLANMPENLENSERYRSMEDAIDHLDEALDNLETAKQEIEAAMG